MRPDWQSQRDCGSKPRVGAPRLPWEGGSWSSQPQRGCGPDTTGEENGRNPVGVDVRGRTVPRVAPGAQSWAGGQNPFGIREVNRKSRKTLEMFAGDAYKAQACGPAGKNPGRPATVAKSPGSGEIPEIGAWICCAAIMGRRFCRHKPAVCHHFMRLLQGRQ